MENATGDGPRQRRHLHAAVGPLGQIEYDTDVFSCVFATLRMFHLPTRFFHHLGGLPPIFFH